MTIMKNALKSIILIVFAFTAAVCSAVFISSCGKEENISQEIIDAEKKSFGADEYEISSSFSVHFDGNMSAGNFGMRADWGEIIEDNSKVQYYCENNNDKLYRTRGFDFTYSNYGYLKDVKKSGSDPLIPQMAADKPEDFYGTEITLERNENYYIYRVKVGKEKVLGLIEKMQSDTEDTEEFDLSGIDFGDEIVIKYRINADGYLCEISVDNLKISVDVEGVKVGATMYMRVYIVTDREDMDFDKAGQCLAYADYYTDEDKTVRWIKNNENPETAELVSTNGHLKGYKIVNHGNKLGIVAGDSATGRIAAASCDDTELFSYVDIYDKDLKNIKTLYIRGAINTLQFNGNFISMNLETGFLDVSRAFMSVVVDLNDGSVVFKNQLDESSRFDRAVLFGNAVLYKEASSNELSFYNIEKDKDITPQFNGKPIKGSVAVNANGNLSVRANCDDATYLLEINDDGEIVASRKKVSTTFADAFIGKYWVGADFNESGKKIYYNAHEEVTEIDIGDYEGNGKAQYMYIDDDFAVILDSHDSGYFIYDFKNKEYILKYSDKELGIIEFYCYLGSENWLSTYYFDDCMYIFGI